MKYRMKITLLLAVIGGIFLAFVYVNPYTGSILLSEFVLQLSGSRGEFALGNSLSELLDFSMRMLPGYIFCAFIGTELYQSFCTASVYIFSRHPSRLGWYVKEVWGVLSAAALFMVFQCIVALITTFVRYDVIVDGAGVGLMIYHLVIYISWLFSVAMLINLLAIHLGGEAAYISVIGGHLVLVALLFFLNDDSLPILRCVNPVSHLVIAWHKSTSELLNSVLNTAYQNLYLEGTLSFMLLISVIVTVAEGVVIKKHDLLISNMETGG